MDDTVTLKPCPFCGSKHLYVKPDEYGDGMFGVDGVHKAGCIIANIDNCDYGEPEEAITAWNTRIAHQPDSALADDASAVIRNLMREMGITNHIVGQVGGKYLSARDVLNRLTALGGHHEPSGEAE